MFAAKLPWLHAQADLRRNPAQVALKGEGIFARGFVRPSEQPLVRVGATSCHAAEHRVALDDDGLQLIIAQPKGAGHACGAAPDDGYDRSLRGHARAANGGAKAPVVAQGAWVRQISRFRKPAGRVPRENLMVSIQFEHDLKDSIRTIQDYPKPGIMFRDITTLLGNPRAFRRAVDELVQPWAGSKIDKVAGIEARGFIIGGAVAHQVSAGFVPIRKKGKLPHKRVSIAYSLEYGLDEMEMHEDALATGDRVILVDDLIATGGTAEGAVKLLRKLGAQVLAACFIIDLPDLGGAEKLRKLDVPVRTLIAFEGH